MPSVSPANALAVAIEALINVKQGLTSDQEPVWVVSMREIGDARMALVDACEAFVPRLEEVDCSVLSSHIADLCKARAMYEVENAVVARCPDDTAVDVTRLLLVNGLYTALGHPPQEDPRAEHDAG